MRLQLRVADGVETGAGAFKLLRVTAVQHPNQTCVEQRQGELVVQACGSLSLYASEGGSPPGVAPSGLRVAWDLSRVTDIDAAGLGAVADAARRTQERGGSIYVPAASRVVHRLAALAGLDTVVAGAWDTRVGAPPLCASCPTERGQH